MSEGSGCCPSTLRYLTLMLLAGPHCFVLFFCLILFLAPCFQIIMCVLLIFSLCLEHWKLIYQCTEAKKKFGRSVEIIFLRRGSSFGCMYFFGTLLWSVDFLCLFSLWCCICLAHFFFFIKMHFSVSNCKQLGDLRFWGLSTRFVVSWQCTGGDVRLTGAVCSVKSTFYLASFTKSSAVLFVCISALI